MTDLDEYDIMDVPNQVIPAVSTAIACRSAKKALDRYWSNGGLAHESHSDLQEIARVCVLGVLDEVLKDFVADDVPDPIAVIFNVLNGNYSVFSEDVNDLAISIYEALVDNGILQGVVVSKDNMLAADEG